MPLVGDGRSGTFSALPGLYGGYKAGVTAAPAGYVVAPSRLLIPPTVTAVTLPYTETWTGADGSGWPAVWTATTALPLTIQGNAGRLTTGSTAYSSLGAYLSGMPATADTDTVVTITPGATGETYFVLAGRSESVAIAGIQPDTGMSCVLVPTFNTLTLYRMVAGVQTELVQVNPGVSWNSGTAYKLRLQLVGTTIRAKFWAASGSEPGTWTASFTDPSAVVAPGKTHIAWGTGADAVSRTLDLDDLTVSVPVVVSTGTATGMTTATGTAAGTRTPQGAAAGTVTATGSATGARTPKATASGTVTTTGSASSKRVPKAAATGTVTTTATAVGTRAAKATTSGTTTATGTAGGIATRSGTGTGTVTTTGTASSKRTPKATTTGTTTASGTASGRRTPVAAATGTVTVTGTAVGSAPLVGVNDGTATGTATVTGAATGRRQPIASSTGTTTATGTAVGAAPAVGLRTGTATGVVTVTGTAAGRRFAKALTLGTLTVTGIAIGSAPGGEAVPAGPDETLVVGADHRLETVGAELRTLEVRGEVRHFQPVADQRTDLVPAATRDLATVGS